MKQSVFYGIILLLLTGLVSCNSKLNIFGGKNKTHSSTTGWRYNDPKNGGFEYYNGYEGQIGPGMVHIPGGTFMMGQNQQDVMGDWNNVRKRVTIASFFMDETEVRNVDYREYLYWLTRVYGGEDSITRAALPDTLVWRDELSYNEPYVQNYLRHTAYSEYPVVGVTWEQANAYAKWRSDRVNEIMLIQNRVIKQNPEQKGAENFNTEAYLAGQYDAELDKGLKDLGSKDGKNIRQANWSDGIMLPDYRLPTEAEWEYAAYGLLGNTEDEIIKEGRVYPWSGKWLRNDGSRRSGNKRKDMGKMMANFARGKGDYMGLAGSLNDGGDITVPVKYFWPNDFGLYNMAGNVNEWVADVYRPLNSLDVEEFNPYRGNVFTVNKTDEKGNLVKKDKYGRLKKRVQTKKELKKRNNYRTGDARNYKDGDPQSRIQQDDASSKIDSSEPMYNNGSGGDLIGITSLISDKSRVYKGGSWRDRAFWLSPSTRRFLNQDLSRDDIGFRCAMSQIGSPEKTPRKWK